MSTELELLTSYSPDLFYQLSHNTFLLPIEDIELKAGKYSLIPYFPIQSLNLPLEIFEVRTVLGQVAFLFKTSMPTIQYSTGLLIYSGAWRANAKDLALTPDAFFLVFKHPKFFLHSAQNKCCLVTSPKLAATVENVLTAV
jgi:hypothetical protein